MAKRLNVSPKKDPFESVDFVHNKTPYQLKIMIRDLIDNMGELANELETRGVHPEIVNYIDTMRDGGKPTLGKVRERYRCVYLNGIIAQYDSLNDQFIFMDGDGNIVRKTSMNIKDLKRSLSKELKG